RYIEGDVQNALADLENRVSLATVATQYGIPRSTLRGRFNGRRTNWERINAATLDNIRHLFNLYETVSWIPPQQRYNADEGENPNMVLVKTINACTWISIVECIFALGVALDPLIIFKAKSI
ncbi:hypothetical protein K469DRAFT_713819, partial [Zopfia rhizophila CBS 207.26]